MKNILIPVLLILLLLAGISSYLYFNNSNQSPEAAFTDSTRPILIGFSIGTLQEERWQRDRDEWVKNVESLKNVSLDIQASNNSTPTQISQIEAMIAKGVDVIVIAPYDATALTEVVQKAHDAGIKILSYDRLILDSNVDIYLSFDNEKVGQFQAQLVIDALKPKIDANEKVKLAYIGGSTTDNNALLLQKGSFSILQPYIDSGKVEIVLNAFTPDWSPEKAYKNMKGYLSNSKGAVDGVIAANDGTAGGAIKALAEYKLDGKVPITGQDAELAACQRVVLGTQTATVYKPIPLLAETGLDIAIKLANNEDITTTTTVSDGKNNIPSVLLEPIAVTKLNMKSTVVEDGYHSFDEIYKK